MLSAPGGSAIVASCAGPAGPDTDTDTPRDARAASGAARPHRRVRHVGVPLPDGALDRHPHLSVEVEAARHPGRHAVRPVAVVPPLPVDGPPHGPRDGLPLCLDARPRSGEPLRRAGHRSARQRAGVRRPASRRGPARDRGQQHGRGRRGPQAVGPRGRRRRPGPLRRRAPARRPRPHQVPGAALSPPERQPGWSRAALPAAAGNHRPRRASPPGSRAARSTSTRRAPGSRRPPRTASTGSSGSIWWARPRVPSSAWPACTACASG